MSCSKISKNPVEIFRDNATKVAGIGMFVFFVGVFIAYSGGMAWMQHWASTSKVIAIFKLSGYVAAAGYGTVILGKSGEFLANQWLQRTIKTLERDVNETTLKAAQQGHEQTQNSIYPL